MVGLLEDVEKHVRAAVPHATATSSRSSATTRDELGGSEFLRTIRGRDEGPCPEVDLDAERAARGPARDPRASEGLLASAHDVSDGGLAVALAECAMQGGLGATIALDSALRARRALLFGEIDRPRPRLASRPRTRPPSARARAKKRRAVRGRRAGSAATASGSTARGRPLIDEPSRR